MNCVGSTNFCGVLWGAEEKKEVEGRSNLKRCGKTEGNMFFNTILFFLHHHKYKIANFILIGL